MANTKISALTAATTPLAGTEVLPIVQSGTTKQISVANLTAGRNVSMADLTTTGNTTLGDASTDTLNVGAGGLVKDSSGNVGMGTASPVFGNGSGLQVSRAGVATVRVTNSTAVNSMEFVADATGGLISARGNFPVRFDNTGGTNLTLETAGNVTFNRGNLVQGTAAKGVNFTANTPAAGMTSQLLNWYEEGTWTPTVTKTVTDPQFTYTLQEGYYTRTGRMVFICGRIGVSTVVSNGSGYWILGGLPFTVGANSSGSVSLAGIVSGGADGLNFNSGATTALITLNGSLLTSNTVGSDYLYFAGCYQV